MDKKQELKLQLLAEECRTCGESIRTLFLATEKVIGLGLAIMAAGMAYGLKEGIHEILVLLPVGIFGVLLYGIYISTEILSLGGYRRYLEEGINAAFGEAIFYWESGIAEKRHSDFVRYALHFVYLLFLAVTIYVSCRTAWRQYGSEVFCALVIVILALLIVLIISFVNMNKSFDKTYKLAKGGLHRDITAQARGNTGEDD